MAPVIRWCDTFEQWTYIIEMIGDDVDLDMAANSRKEPRNTM